ncbi:MAG: HEAT repeat domain-containing protein [Verrucomicrobiota bacterium]|jgi:HEAT repeat protein
MKHLSCRRFKSPAVLLALAATCATNPTAVRAADADPEALVRGLEQTQTLSQAWKDLLNMGDRAVPALIAGLQSTNQEIRSYAASLLGEIKSEKEIAPLVKLSRSQDSSVSSQALVALGSIGGPQAAEAIIAAMDRGIHPASGSSSLLLAAIGDNRAVEPLAKLLASRDSGDFKTGGEGMFKVWARREAAEALGRFRDPRARAALLDAIKNDPVWDVYHAAKQALYRMEGQPTYADDDTLSAKVALAVTKQPEPTNGAEAFVQSWRAAHADGPGVPMIAWKGPRVEDYAAEVDIERARNAVVEIGKAWDPEYPDARADGVVELLMEYLRNGKFYVGPENAKMLLIRIGKPAIPALENGVKRGDEVMARNCEQCIQAIKAAEATTPAKAN